MPGSILARFPVVAALATICSVGSMSYPSHGTPQLARADEGAAAQRRTLPASRPPAPPAASRYDEYRIAAGTALPVELRTLLSSDSSRRDDVVEGRLLRPVTADDVELVPANAIVLGTVTDAEPAGPRTPGRLAFTFTVVQHPETGSRAMIRATVLSFRTELPQRGKPLPAVSRVKGSDATVTLLQPLVVRIPLIDGTH